MRKLIVATLPAGSVLAGRRGSAAILNTS